MNILSHQIGIILLFVVTSHCENLLYLGITNSPYIPLQAKTTKKIVLRMECTECKYRKQVALKRCKHFELGGDKKRKVRNHHSTCRHFCVSIIQKYYDLTGLIGLSPPPFPYWDAAQQSLVIPGLSNLCHILTSEVLPDWSVILPSPHFDRCSNHSDMGFLLFQQGQMIQF